MRNFSVQGSVSRDPKQMRLNIVCSLEIFIEVTKLTTPYLGMT